MAAYYKVVGEEYYYEDREKFRSAVSRSDLVLVKFFIQNEGQAFRMVYETYSKPDNAWRLQIYHFLKKIGQTLWNDDLEEIEGILLGYRGMYGGATCDASALSGRIIEGIAR